MSKFLSLILRHNPELVGLVLDENGWCDVNDLIDKVNNHNGNSSLDLKQLRGIVDSNDKKRFTINEETLKIRANQGHSLDIDLKLPETTPPDILYHGTASRFIDSIKSSGLENRNRHHVHLTENIDTALNVGGRYGTPTLIEINTKQMVEDGLTFYRSDNGVWLTDHVDPKYMVFQSTERNVSEEYKTIAKFLGWYYLPANSGNEGRYGWYVSEDVAKNKTSLKVKYLTEYYVCRKTKDLNFFYDYDRLMLVVEKIESINSQRYGGFNVHIVGDTCNIIPKRKQKLLPFNPTKRVEGNKIQSIYWTCLEFIKNYDGR